MSRCQQQKAKKYNSFLWLVHFQHSTVSFDIHNLSMCNVLLRGQAQVSFGVIHFGSVALSCEIHAFSTIFLNVLLKTKQNIRLVKPTVQGDSLYSVMDQETYVNTSGGQNPTRLVYLKVMFEINQCSFPCFNLKEKVWLACSAATFCYFSDGLKWEYNLGWLTTQNGL